MRKEEGGGRRQEEEGRGNLGQGEETCCEEKEAWEQWKWED